MRVLTPCPRVLTPCPPLPAGEGERRAGSTAASRFVVTEHALDRFFERYEGPEVLTLDRCEPVLRAELQRAVPFGGQAGNGELYLLPCGLVAAVARHDGCRFVKTVLTRQQAIANMESQGAVLRVSRGLPRQFRNARSAESRAELHALAERHFKAGVGRSERNTMLRERGFDPGGEAGEVYRAAYRALIDAMWARKREEYWQRRRLGVRNPADTLQ